MDYMDLDVRRPILAVQLNNSSYFTALMYKQNDCYCRDNTCKYSILNITFYNSIETCSYWFDWLLDLWQVKGTACKNDGPVAPIGNK